MIWSDIEGRVRSLLGESSSVSPITTQDLMNYANQIMSGIASVVLQADPDFFAESQMTLSYVAGQQEYSLTTTPLEIRFVEVTDLGYNFELRRLDFTDKDKYPIQAEPEAYYLRNAGGTWVIGFLPAPWRSGTSNVLITYVPAIVPIQYTTDTPGIPLELHPALVYGTAMLARERDQLPAQAFAALYQAELNNYLSYLAMGKGEGPRYIEYLG